MNAANRNHPFPVLAYFLLVVVASLLCGCSSHSKPEQKITQTLLPPTPDQSNWASEGDVIVARVDSQPIYASTVRLFLKHNPDLSPRQALEKAMELEAVAMDGAKSFGSTPPANLVHRYRQLLVQRFLSQNFEENLTVDTVPNEYLEKAFKMKNVRIHFVHYDTFYVRDLQLLCCHVNHIVCARQREDNAACFKDLKGQANRLHKLIKDANPKTADEFSALVDRAKKEIHPEVQVQEFSFFYDVNETYEVNRNRVNLMTQPINEGVLTMKVNEVSKVFEDQYGYHILFLEKHVPEANGTLEDEDVRKELSAKIYPAVQREEFMRNITQSFRKYNVTIDDEALNQLRTFGRQPQPETALP
ncbi:MAG: hypothetical protein CMH54_04465 [Myxococcales bacterium]|nr:hypothetical protein [Myxococcales bacterium]